MFFHLNFELSVKRCPPTYSALADFPEGGQAGKGGRCEPHGRLVGAVGVVGVVGAVRGVGMVGAVGTVGMVDFVKVLGH
jgi:hypothetical protein